MRLWVFTFGRASDYDKQQAVVLAETEQEARGLLLADMARQEAAWPRDDQGDRLWSPEAQATAERGYSLQFNEGMLADAEADGNPVWSTDEPVVYAHGIDG